MLILLYFAYLMYLSIKLRNINITNNLENNPNNFACKQWFYAKKIGIYFLFIYLFNANAHGILAFVLILAVKVFWYI